jgi:hypothetical protein
MTVLPALVRNIDININERTPFNGSGVLNLYSSLVVVPEAFLGRRSMI